MSKNDHSILHQMKRGNIQFLHVFNQNGKRIRRGINSNPTLIKALAKKEFDRRANEIILNNVDAINDAISKQIPFDPDRIQSSMDKAYTLLPEEYFFDRDKLVVAAGLDGEAMARKKA